MEVAARERSLPDDTVRVIVTAGRVTEPLLNEGSLSFEAILDAATGALATACKVARAALRALVVPVELATRGEGCAVSVVGSNASVSTARAAPSAGAVGRRFEVLTTAPTAVSELPRAGLFGFAAFTSR